MDFTSSLFTRYLFVSNTKLVDNLLLFCILSGLHASNETEISFLNQSSYVAANSETTLSSQGDVEPKKISKKQI